VGCLFPCPVLLHKRRRDDTVWARLCAVDAGRRSSSRTLVNFLCVSVPGCTLPRVSRGASLTIDGSAGAASPVMFFGMVDQVAMAWQRLYFSFTEFMSISGIHHLIWPTLSSSVTTWCSVGAVDPAATVWSCDFAQNLLLVTQSCRGICVT
jgi:hypothetical protein